MKMSKKVEILIVDDQVGMVKSLSFILEKKGYAVTIVTDGMKAVDKIEQKPFDIILMDIKMPLMNGVETYKMIKKIRPETVVIMMTAYTMEDLVQEALEEGAYGIIHKPFDMERMLNLVEEARETKNGALILLVDDDEATCVSLRNILIKRGYKVNIAHNGEEAIKKAEENGFSIIFIDVKLPTINGLETYLGIKKVNPKTVAVLMTAYRQEVSGLVEEALSKDAYTCLYKPLDIEKLLALVSEILRGEKKHEDN